MATTLKKNLEMASYDCCKGLVSVAYLTGAIDALAPEYSEKNVDRLREIPSKNPVWAERGGWFKGHRGGYYYLKRNGCKREALEEVYSDVKEELGKLSENETCKKLLNRVEKIKIDHIGFFL